MTKTDSNSGRSFRFMLASWNSYSKSETARRPRSTVWIPRERAYSTISPSNESTSTRWSFPTASRMKPLRSATLKSGLFPGLLATATTSRSKRFRPRWMMATWPLVSGSKLPG